MLRPPLLRPVAAAALLLVVLLAVPVPAATWRSCVARLGEFMVLHNRTHATWTEAGRRECGFGPLGTADMVQLMFPKKDGAASGNGPSLAILGDSLMLRFFILASRWALLPPSSRQFTRVAQSPPLLEEHRCAAAAVPTTGGAPPAARQASPTDAELRGISPSMSQEPPMAEEALPTKASAVAGPGCATLRFVRLIYVSQGVAALEQAFRLSTGRGVLVLGVGNWDLNWKLTKNSPPPGFVGPMQNVAAGERYWTRHVQVLMATLARLLAETPEARRPMVVFREQYLPNCGASRFTAKNRKFRQCGSVLRPVLVPMYRRVLAPLAWALRVPVVPTDWLIRDGYRYCGLSDGLHLDWDCMVLEQQAVWNVVRMMLARRVHQGLPAGVELPNATQFLDAETYERWAARFWEADVAAAEPSLPPPAAPAGASAQVTREALGPADDEHSGGQPRGAWVREFLGSPVVSVVLYIAVTAAVVTSASYCLLYVT